MIDYGDDDDYIQGYGQIKEAFRTLTKDDILNPYKSDHDFRSSNEGENVGYNLNVFDERYHEKLEAVQPTKVEIKFWENVFVGIYGYALLLTNKLVSIGSDGQRHFDLF